MGNNAPRGICSKNTQKDNIKANITMNTFIYKTKYRNIIFAVIQKDIFSVKTQAIVNPTLGI
jgi:hypothetical protein